MKIVVYSNTSGGVSELFPSPYARLCSGFISDGVTTDVTPSVSLDQLGMALDGINFDPVFSETEEEFVSRIASKDVPPDATNILYVDFEDLPSEDGARDAWEIHEGRVVVSAEKLAAIVSSIEPRLVPKRLIIDRLHDVGKLEPALAALGAQDAYTQQRWASRDAIYYNDDTLVRALKAIGADPAAILAPPEA